MLALLVVIVLIAGGIFAYSKHNHSQSNANSLPAGWLEYKATSYGFKFDHPKDWGTPKLNNYTQDKITGYNIMFSPPQGKYTVLAILESSGSSGSSSTDINRQFVQKNLSSGKEKFLKSDTSSYSTVLVDPKTNSPGQINLYQIVNLSKIHVTAVNTELIISPKAGCPADKLNDDATKGCITNSIYDEASKFSKSISSI